MREPETKITDFNTSRFIEFSRIKRVVYDTCTSRFQNVFLIAAYNDNARNVCDTLDIIMLIELLTVTDELTKIGLGLW